MCGHIPSWSKRNNLLTPEPTDFHLAEYSTTWLLEGDQKSGEGTLEAAKLWEQILESTVSSLPLPFLFILLTTLPS